MTTGSCASCGRGLPAGEERRVSRPVVWAVSLAFGFFHGGMWVKETMDKPFCERCARQTARLALAVSAVVLAGASAGLWIWLRGPGR